MHDIVVHKSFAKIVIFIDISTTILHFFKILSIGDYIFTKTRRFCKQITIFRTFIRFIPSQHH